MKDLRETPTSSGRPSAVSSRRRRRMSQSQCSHGASVECYPASRLILDSRRGFTGHLPQAGKRQCDVMDDALGRPGAIRRKRDGSAGQFIPHGRCRTEILAARDREHTHGRSARRS
jgi:hypothetical protein